ncbi:Cytochrome c551 peroxidase precursor [Pseudobythopirellula maris]|uniref:Cytochrome c551 peroxidase n=1 Tax=Pseudobythopirellula maris TaxID=2527991 RepID=A0A5C5ZMN8_9BACT|nr:cytochrome c peroxidase [Pseudobythopirellula maris]TWT87713.1 Cytochrome c551 peroxidase precursor [Pseudobythopirellula maris]
MRSAITRVTAGIVCLSPGVVVAAAPGVPSLSDTPAGYVAYAVDDLPQWFQTPIIEGFDNTPADNPITDAGAELGRVLFYDQRLSHNDGTSCASCHSQSTGFTDTAELSEGFEGGLTGRHSMSLANARYYEPGRFFWDERAATLEDQVLMPIQDAVEMGSDLDELVDELQATDYYPVLFERAFGDSAVTSDRMAEAMAQFVRAMASYQSEYDQALAARTAPGPNADPNFAAVDTIENPALATEGHALFAADCANCHRTNAQVTDKAHNIGLDETNTDAGAGAGRFKVPSLRNAAERGRYMHDGRFESLEEVVEHYSSGVADNPNLSVGLTAGGFGYSADEQAALVAFLETLSDEAFLTSTLFSDPFVTLPGDYNGDGVVDLDDYTAWGDAYGDSSEGLSGPLFADGNGDGVVDAADFTLWRDNLGRRWDDGLSLSATAAVPEPRALIMVTALGAMLAASRWRRG